MKYCPACHRTYPADYNVCPADQSALQSAHELQPGMVIRGKYEILQQIGIGGMGFVYKGRHITFNELCAIKIVNDVIAGDANFLQRFQTEAVVTRKLRHPNAVRVDDFDYTEDGRPFIVMELVEGKNVGEILESDGPFRVPRAIRVAIQVAQALGFAHKLGIVHRDIKPGNIILTRDERGQEVAKVLDFGIAKLKEAVGDKPGMTMTGMVVGTPLYMSPEQFMGKKAGSEIDGRSDIYSLGVVLYQMVTARLPFEGDTLYSIMMQHMQGAPRPPHEIAPELQIPEVLSHVILKAIDKSTEQRYQTAEEFAWALEQVASPGISEPSLPEASAPSFRATFMEGSSRATPVPAPPPVPAIPPPSAGSVEPRTAGNARTPVPAAAAPEVPSAEVVRTVAIEPPVGNVKAPAPDSLFVKSAEQHVFVQPRKLGIKNVIVITLLIVAAAVVGGVGYLKYQAFRRVQIENAVNDRLGAAPSVSLRNAGIRVSVSNTREVTLDGEVTTQADFATAESLAASVPGVAEVSNRIRVVAPPNGQSTGQGGSPAESPDSLIQKGLGFMDTGDYASAIDCFTRAAAGPEGNPKAQALVDQARRAQQTEEKLLRSRH